jgi:hypothetical protein
MELKMELNEFWEDASWAESHYPELQNLYLNKWVAVFRGEVVASGDSLGEVESEAKKLAGEGIPAILYIEGGAAIYSGIP